MTLVHHIRSFFPVSRLTCLALGALATLASGCPGGDSSSGVGDLGRLQYSLYANYFMTSDEIRSLRLVAGHRQWISVTWADEEQAGEDDGEAVWENRLVGSSYAPEEPPYMDAEVKAEQPGTYPLETFRDGELIDRIDLTFERPAEIDLLTFVRQPGEDSFTQVTAGVSTEVIEGSQVAFVVVPLAADGGRLAGAIETTRQFSPGWAAVEGENVYGVYEDGVWQGGSSDSYYLIDPGRITVDFQDTVYGIRESHTFEVTSANPADRDVN